jgi:hypothetical protein
MPTAIVTFTARSKEDIISSAGSQAWVLDRAHARQQAYLVCTRNAYSESTEGDEPHGSAFLVGKISDIVPATDPDDAGRWLIKFSEYALVDIPDAWPGLRNPVHYTTLEKLGIDPAALEFEPAPATNRTITSVEPAATDVKPLTIAQAKRGLAVAFGVREDAVEITIRG